MLGKKKGYGRVETIRNKNLSHTSNTKLLTSIFMVSLMPFLFHFNQKKTHIQYERYSYKCNFIRIARFATKRFEQRSLQSNEKKGVSLQRLQRLYASASALSLAKKAALWASTLA